MTRTSLLAAGLVIAFAVMVLQRGDSDWLFKAGIAVAFVLPAAVVVAAFQAVTGQRLIWMLELLAIPVVACFISAVVLVIRNVLAAPG